MEGNPPTDSEHHNSSYHSIGHSKLRAWSLTSKLLSLIYEGSSFFAINYLPPL